MPDERLDLDKLEALLDECDEMNVRAALYGDFDNASLRALLALAREAERLREHFTSCGECMDCLCESSPDLYEIVSKALAGEEEPSP